MNKMGWHVLDYNANEYGNEPADSTRSLLPRVCLLIRCYTAPVLCIILKAV